MLGKIKNKIKRFWKWIIGILIPVTFAASIAGLSTPSPEIGDVIGGKQITEFELDNKTHFPISNTERQVIKYAKIGRVMDENISINVIKEANKKGRFILREDINKRTKHSRTFETDKKDIFITEIVSGVPQYYKDIKGKWWQAEYATTTVTDFPKLKKVPTPLFGFIQKAFAATDTFYPDPDPETNTVDGCTISTISADPTNWEVARDNSSGSAATDTNTTSDECPGVMSNQGAGNRIRINRLVFLFDTSSIPDTDNIDSANIQLYVVSKKNRNNDAYDYVSIMETNPASNTGLVASDFDEVRGTDGNFPLGADIVIQEQSSSQLDITNITTSAYNTWNFNTTGEGHISKTGVSKFGASTGNDIEDVAYPGSTKSNSLNISMAETTGTTQDPKLVVTHSAGGGGGSPPTKTTPPLWFN